MTDLGDLSLEDTLAHYGVKGMKWGVRRGADGARPIAKTLDKSAFGRLAKKNAANYDARKAKKVSQSEVHKARQNVANQKRNVAAAKASAKAAKRPETKLKRKLEYLDKKADLLNNPDRATAQRITKGDLKVTAILAVSSPFSAATTAASVGAGTAKRVATRKVIERRQSSGSYTRAASNRKANARTAAR